MQIRHPEWRAEQEPTRYPFSQDATLVNDAGDVIFETTFLDATFYIVGATAGLYLSRVSVDHETVTIYVGDPTTAQLASGSFSRAAPPDQLRFVDLHDRPAGLIVSESIRLSLFSSWSFGDHDFTAAQTAFVARCCHAMPAVGVRGFELDDGSILTGDVWLVGDDGVVLTCDSVDVTAGCGIAAGEYLKLRIDIVGDSLFRRKLCSAPDFFETPHYVQTITFCAPGLMDSYSSYVSSNVSESSEIIECSDEPAPDGVVVDILILTDVTSSALPGLETWQREWIFQLIENVVKAPFGAGTTFASYDIKVAVADYKDYTDGAPFDGVGFRVIQPFASPDVAYSATSYLNPPNFLCGGGGDLYQEQCVALVNLSDTAVWTDPAGLNGRATSHKMIFLGFGHYGHVNCPGSTTSALPYASFYPTEADCDAMININAAVEAANIDILPVNIVSYSGGDVWITDSMSQMYQIAGLGYFSYPRGWQYSGAGERRSESMNQAYAWLLSRGINDPDEPCEDTIIVTPKETKTRVVTHFPATETSCVKCGPGDYGDVKIFVHGQVAPDTVLRVRPTSEGLIIETVGETIERKD